MSSRFGTQLVLTLVIMILGACPGNAADDQSSRIDLEKIVVSPDRLREPLSQSANSVSVITQQDIETRKTEFAKNLLAEENDIHVTQAGAYGGPTYVRIRGALPSHTLLLIDGIKVYDPASVDGSYDFANLPVDNIDRIEITRGPQSSLYGSDAIGGLIAIESKKPDKSFFEAGVEAGSFWTLNEYVNLGGFEKGLHYSFGFSQIDSRGISNADDRTIPGIQETDPYTRKSFAGRLDYDVTGDLTVGMTMRSVSARFEYDNSNMITWALQDNDELVGKSDLFLYSLYVEHRPLEQYDYTITYSYMDNFRRDYDYPAGMSDWYDGMANRLDYQNNFHILDWDTVSIGYDYVFETADSFYTDFANGTSDTPKTSDRNSGLYLQNKAHYGDLMGTTQSMRVDHHSQYGTNVTYKVDAFYLTPVKARLRGSWSTSFKAPSLYQLNAPANPAWLFLGGNPALQPEKAKSYEIGIEQPFLQKHLTLSATYFHTRFSNLIEYYTDPTTFLSTYQNAAKAKSLGIELAAEADFLEGKVRIRASYTQLDTKDYSTDNEILRDPWNMAQVTIRVRPIPKMETAAYINYVGPSLDIGADKIKEYTVVDWIAEYSLSRNISVYSKITNLFNKHYQQIRGYGMPGIGAYGGVKAKF